jgi:hypothetical protein
VKSANKGFVHEPANTPCIPKSISAARLHLSPIKKREREREERKLNRFDYYSSEIK